MQIPDRSLLLTKVEAATRQIEAAIEALARGDFDIVITLAGVAEGMIEKSTSLFAYHRDHPKMRELGMEQKELVAVLNKERDWLKHLTGPETMEITLYSAAFMIPRSLTKLNPQCCTPLMRDFLIWWRRQHVETDA
jgi:hypothetical protein